MGAVELIDDPRAVFAVGVKAARDAVYLKPVGELDLATVPMLADQVTELLTAGFEQLIVDLRGLSFIDVSGLRFCSALANVRDLTAGGCR